MKENIYDEYIEACLDCVVACNNCTISCLNEPEVKSLAKCIQLNLECAAVCKAAAELMTLQSTFSGRLIDLCMDVCNDCAAECGLHASMGMEHCRICAEACLHCATVCSTLPVVNEKGDN
jgi:ribosomal protein L31